MATKHFCDVCKREYSERQLVPITMSDGEHPHSGSPMYRVVEFCPNCLQTNKPPLVKDDGKSLYWGTDQVARVVPGDGRMHLSGEWYWPKDTFALFIPYLQKFAETGRFDDPPKKILKVKLTYFKLYGKYYADGEFEVEEKPLHQIWDDIRDMFKKGVRPGLPNGVQRFDTLVEVPEHEHNHPRLIKAYEVTNCTTPTFTCPVCGCHWFTSDGNADGTRMYRCKNDGCKWKGTEEEAGIA